MASFRKSSRLSLPVFCLLLFLVFPFLCLAENTQPEGQRWRRDLYFYTDFLGSLTGYIVRDSNGSDISTNGGLFSNLNSVGGATALSFGFGMDIARHFAFEIEVFGRWIFQDQKFNTSVSSYEVDSIQLVGAILKPSVTFSDGNFKIFALIGAGGMFFLAKNSNVDKNIDVMSFSLVYGLGFSAKISKHVGFFLRFFGIAPIHGMISIDQQSIAVDGYGIDFGVTVRT